MSVTQNVRATAKPRGKPFQKGGDSRRAPGGRKPNPQSITYWLKELGNMTPKAAGELCELYAVELKKGGDKSSIFAVIALRLLMSQMNEPDSRLLEVLLDRTEGKVSQPIEVYDWRKDAEANGIDPDSLADNLFAKVKRKVDADDTGDDRA